MIGVFVYHKVVAVAVPAPIRRNRPVPRSNLKGNAPGEPKNMTVAVESFNFVPVRWAEMFETSVFERMIHVIALVVGLVVAIPMIIAHVRQAVDAPTFPALRLGSGGE